jgi:hypothetical protein
MTGQMAAEESCAEARRAVDDDPLNSWVVGMHSYQLDLTGRHEEALVEAKRAVALDVDSFFSQWSLMRAHAWSGEFDAAIAMAPTLLAESGRHQWVLGLLAWIYGKVGRPDAARAVHDELDGRSRHEFVSSFWVATAASAAGLADQAIRRVEQAVGERDTLAVWSRVTPLWTELRKDPRFADTVRAVWKS